MRLGLAFALIVVAGLAMGGPAAAQVDNRCTTVVLHSAGGTMLNCTSLDCDLGPPLVTIPNPAGQHTLYMFLKNYERVNGVQVAFDWPPGWTFSFGIWECQAAQLVATTPSAPGPTTGSIVTAFNPIEGGALAPIGMMVFSSVGAGCLSIVESSYPFGNHVIDSDSVPLETSIRDENEGRVCVGEDGRDTCACIPAAVKPATWGRIKATYNQP
jgi:hypothetical protein